MSGAYLIELGVPREVIADRRVSPPTQVGIPAARRPTTWFALSGAQELYRADPSGFGTR